MKIRSSRTNFDLCYCTNIHPGESWKNVFESLKVNTKKIYEHFPSFEKGIGLRLSAKAVGEALKDTQKFKAWLSENNYFISTINAFPYGDFHQTEVKKNVYLPDWSQTERVQYTKDIIDFIIAVNTQANCTISTVPIGWKEDFQDKQKLDCAVLNLQEITQYLKEVNRVHKTDITLALEPEPGCYLENTEDVLNFFNNILDPIKLSKESIGICYDTCHFAVMFEDQISSIQRIEAAGIKILKYQISSGLSFQGTSNDFHKEISPFIDGVYLHQIAMRDIESNKLIKSYADIDELPRTNEVYEFRVHFHVPIFMDKLTPFVGTNNFIKEITAYLKKEKKSSLLEVETYTFNVLPQKYKLESINDNIKRELEWLQALLN